MYEGNDILIIDVEDNKNNKQGTLKNIALPKVHKKQIWVMFVCFGTLGSEKVSTIMSQTLVCEGLIPINKLLILHVKWEIDIGT